MNTASGGTTERSSPDGSCIFRAPLDLGEGAWTRSQALGKRGPANDICCIGLGRSHRKPEGRTHQQTSLSTEDQGCCDWSGGKIDICEGAITCSERVAIRLTGKQAGPRGPPAAMAHKARHPGDGGRGGWPFIPAASAVLPPDRSAI